MLRPEAGAFKLCAGTSDQQCVASGLASFAPHKSLLRIIQGLCLQQYGVQWRLHARDNVFIMGSTPQAAESIGKRRTIVTFAGPISMRWTMARMISRFVAQSGSRNCDLM